MLSKNLCQKSLKSGRSIFFRLCSLLASTDTYNWVTGCNVRMASGNCAFVTKNEDIPLECRSLMRVLISGYIIGSPTSDNAQCLTSMPSASLSGLTPGTPGKTCYVWYRHSCMFKCFSYLILGILIIPHVNVGVFLKIYITLKLLIGHWWIVFEILKHIQMKRQASITFTSTK